MDDRIVLRQACNHLVHEMLPLIADEFYGAAVSTPDVLVKKFCRGAGCVVAYVGVLLGRQSGFVWWPCEESTQELGVVTLKGK